MTFKQGFNSYACEGDSISCEVEGFTVTARLFRDDCGDTPAERDCGFWPSLDPDAAGWIGSSSKAEYQRQLKRSQEIMTAWQNDEWFYVGVSVTVERAGIQLVKEYHTALWGIECNYPGSDNSYLTEVANELLSEALSDAKERLAILCDNCEAEAR